MKSLKQFGLCWGLCWCSSESCSRIHTAVTRQAISSPRSLREHAACMCVNVCVTAPLDTRLRNVLRARRNTGLPQQQAKAGKQIGLGGRGVISVVQTQLTASLVCHILSFRFWIVCVLPPPPHFLSFNLHSFRSLTFFRLVLTSSYHRLPSWTPTLLLAIISFYSFLNHKEQGQERLQDPKSDFRR